MGSKVVKVVGSKERTWVSHSTIHLYLLSLYCTVRLGTGVFPPKAERNQELQRLTVNFHGNKLIFSSSLSFKII